MAATVSENRIKIDKTPTSKLTPTNHAKNQLLPESIELTHVLSTFGLLVDNLNRQNNMATTVVLYAN
jgi:UDP-N-acetylglucosamine 2-epimerase